MSGPIIASPENVAHIATRLQDLWVELDLHDFRFYAIDDAEHFFADWVDAFIQRELDQNDVANWRVQWEDPNQEHDFATLLSLALGEIEAGKKPLETKTCLCDPPDTDVSLAHRLLAAREKVR